MALDFDPELLRLVRKIQESADSRYMHVGSEDWLKTQFSIHDALDYLGAKIDAENGSKDKPCSR